MATLLSLAVVSLLHFGLVSATDVPSRLFQVLPDADTSSILECTFMKDKESCEKIDIDFDVMRNASEVVLAIDGIVFNRSAFDVPPSRDGDQVFSFEGPDFSDAVLTYSEEPGYPDLNGRFHYTKEGSSYMIDNCGSDCHVLIKKVKSEFKEPEEEIPRSRALLDEELSPKMRDALALGKADTRNTATVSTMLYYTPALRSRVSDPEGQMRNLVDAANAAFARTQIPLRLSVFCIEELGIGESSTTSQRMRDIRSAKGSESNVLNGADIAVVVMASITPEGVGGQANLIGPASPNGGPAPFCWSQNDELVFAHEVGHLFGGEHNREQLGGGSSRDFSYGYLMRGSNMATIMAYPRGQYNNWIGYFSNDDFRMGGVRMGTSRDDNKRQLTEARFVVAGYGSEGGSCGGGEECGNEYDDASCNGWANSGFCSGRYEEFMSENCKEACDLCEGGGSGTCQNEYGDASCNGWANSGFCSGRYEEFMSENCKKACNLCGGVACVDDNGNCPRWAQAGYCSGRYEAYMRENCKKSCNVC